MIVDDGGQQRRDRPGDAETGEQQKRVGEDARPLRLLRRHGRDDNADIELLPVEILPRLLICVLGDRLDQQRKLLVELQPLVVAHLRGDRLVVVARRQ